LKEKNVEPNRLKELRTEYGLYQGEMARFLGVTPAVVSRHETVEKGLSHDAVIKYARLYKVMSHELFYAPGEVRENRLKELRDPSWLTEEEVSKIMDIPVNMVRGHERGKASLSEDHIQKYMMLYKVWSYELLRRPWGVEDTWVEEGTYRPERRPAASSA